MVERGLRYESSSLPVRDRLCEQCDKYISYMSLQTKIYLAGNTHSLYLYGRLSSSTVQYICKSTQ